MLVPQTKRNYFNVKLTKFSRIFSKISEFLISKLTRYWPELPLNKNLQNFTVPFFFNQTSAFNPGFRFQLCFPWNRIRFFLFLYLLRNKYLQKFFSKCFIFSGSKSGQRGRVSCTFLQFWCIFDLRLRFEVNQLWLGFALKVYNFK